MTFPTLTTERLTLRVPTLDDLPHFADFLGNERSTFLGGPIHDAKTISRAFGHFTGLWILRGYSAFVATLRDGTPIGTVGPWFPTTWPEPEFGWTLWDARQEGQGYIAEAMQTIMPWSWNTLCLKTAVAYIAPGNAASINVAQRLGGLVDPNAPLPDEEPTVVYRFLPEAA